MILSLSMFSPSYSYAVGPNGPMSGDNNRYSKNKIVTGSGFCAGTIATCSCASFQAIAAAQDECYRLQGRPGEIIDQVKTGGAWASSSCSMNIYLECK